jgi:hypothetical protein
MPNHSVARTVTPCLRMECKFWLGDDGWNGSSEHPSISIQACSFKHAKAENAGHPRNVRGAHHTGIKPTPEQLDQLYNHQQLSSSEIARQDKVSKRQ